MTMRPGNAARLAALVVVALLLTPASAAAAPPTITTAVIQTGLDIPWDLAFLPDGKMLVTERPGRIRIYASGEPGAALVRTAVLGLGVHAEGEAGLMGITVDPAFSSNRLVYVCVSRDVNGQWLNQLVRYRLSSSLFFVYRNVMIWGMRANTNHNGCAVEFGRDGKIWLTMGDAGAPGDAQDPSALNGKVLRINPDGSIPSDNPIMPHASRRTIVYSMGHRNPQGLAFTPQGALYEVEHGPDRDDEINRIQAGGNYGWPCYTGPGVRNSAYAGPCGPATAYRAPAWSSGSLTLATSGAAFAASNAWGDWRNHLFVSTLKQMDVRRFSSSNGGAMMIMRQTLFDGTWGRLRAMVLAHGGALYLSTSNGGATDRVIRLTPVP
jgi:glucose/arabinose dehydrogenase